MTLSPSNNNSEHEHHHSPRRLRTSFPFPVIFVAVATLTAAVIGLVILGIFFGKWRGSVEYPSGFLRSAVGPTSKTPLPDKKYLVYGFAPYWNLQRTTIRPELTHFMYFSLPMTADGELDGITNSGGSVSKTRWQSSRLKETVATLDRNQEFAVTLTQFSNEDIKKLLSSTEAQQNYLTSLTMLLDTSPYPITALNIDIEYNGVANSTLRQQYVDFIRKTKQLLTDRQSAGKPVVALSLSIYASAATKPWLWDVEALAPHLDYMVVMAYDFHRMSSSVAGPVAPIFGGQEQWSGDIMTHLQEFLKLMPAEKVILGIPFYGYEWETTSPTSQASVFPGTGSTASYQRVQDLLNDKEKLGLEEHWDEAALSPYVTFTEKNRAHVIYYENQRSLSYKLDIVRDLRLAGIAIWALGYESESRQPWDVIHSKFYE